MNDGVLVAHSHSRGMDSNVPIGSNPHTAAELVHLDSYFSIITFDSIIDNCSVEPLYFYVNKGVESDLSQVLSAGVHILFPIRGSPQTA